MTAGIGNIFRIIFNSLETSAALFFWRYPPRKLLLQAVTSLISSIFLPGLDIIVGSSSSSFLKNVAINLHLVPFLPVFLVLTSTVTTVTTCNKKQIKANTGERFSHVTGHAKPP